MKTPICILAVCVVWLFVDVSVADLQTIKTLRATERFIEDINRGEFASVVQELSNTMSPYLGVLSSVIKQAAAYNTVSNQSVEPEYLRELFESINQKLDEVILQFEELKKLIRWPVVQSTFASCESNIHTAFDNFKLIFQAQSSRMNQQKQLFINSYEHYYDDCGHKLFMGFILDNKVVRVSNQGFLRPVMNYTEYNRGEMRIFMLGTLKNLLMAANVELGYMTIHGYSSNIPWYRQQWEVRFQQIQEKMKMIDVELENNYLVQSLKDIDTFAKNNLGLSNPMFGRNLYQELSKKYFWRDWLVVVSKHSDSEHEAKSTVFNGVVKSTHGTQDLVVDSVEKNASCSDINTSNKCASLQQTCINKVTVNTCPDPYGDCQQNHWQCPRYSSDNADVIFGWISNVGNCPSYGVINTGMDPVYYGGPTDNSRSRLFVCDLGICNFNVHFFGPTS